MYNHTYLMPREQLLFFWPNACQFRRKGVASIDAFKVSKTQNVCQCSLAMS